MDSLPGAMDSQDLSTGTAQRYLAFANESAGRCPAYEAMARSVAQDRTVLSFLGSLPSQKRQPNLLFAAARYLLGEPADLVHLRTLIGRRTAELSRVMLTRRTQTNEPARCATLLPALAQLPEPLALIEVGASAGLTLLFDRYSYDYEHDHGRLRLTGRDPDAPTLRCTARGPVPLPSRLPAIAWRAGLDLNPLDVTSDDDIRWLSCLVWPGEGDRDRRLAAAIATARRDPPAVHRGDLLTDLPALAAQAPAGATLVIFHSAVLAYVSAAGRQQFADVARSLPAVWLSNEASNALPWVSVPRHDGMPFALVRDGRTPLAFTDGHGLWVDWL